ncbi:MAG: ribulose-phosphate 3-epimerase [Candidatus Omnitrophica bacterium]|nr:ribulose-phosphate 3-epimerase [Candidatus Omnitrophota bacterium]
MQKVEILPSLLAADFSDLRGQIKKIERAGCVKVHLDVMDGHFVPNLSFGPQLIKSIRKITALYFQAHLMIDRPELYLEDFKRAGVDGIIIHEEACCNFRKTLKEIRRLKLKNGITVKPKTALNFIETLAKELDYILIMAVEPGFSGQLFIKGMEDKVADVKRMLQNKKLEVPIGVDGGINLKNIPLVVKAGADELIAGEAVFSGDIIKNIRALYKKANARI